MARSVPTWQRIAAFTLGLAVVFGAAVGIGRLVGPLRADEADADEHGVAHDTAGEEGHDHGAPADDEVLHVNPVAHYTLDLERAAVPGGQQRLAFRVVDESGEPLTSYDVVHEKQLHLIAVRRDLSSFRHVHPSLDADSGLWTVPVRLEPGPWRLYADFAPEGGEQTLAEADLDVRGGYRPLPLGTDTETATVDGYEVHLTRDDSGMVSFHVTRGGRDVTDLQPYLGAYGHLVAIAADDLSYLHVHPEDGAAGPEVAFHAEFAEPGRYRLFLDFRHGGRVHTADFTITVGSAGGAGEQGSGEETDEHDQGGGHDH